MKKILMAAGCLLSCMVFAQQSVSGQRASPPDGHHNFDQVKQKHLAQLGERISKLQQAQSCVQAATDFQALRACRPEHDRHGQFPNSTH